MSNMQKQKLTWPEWSRISENQKLIGESMVKAKIKYQHDLSLAENYNRYLMNMMGLVSTPSAPGIKTGGSSDNK